MVTCLHLIIKACNTYFQVIVSGWGTTWEYGEQSEILLKVRSTLPHLLLNRRGAMSPKRLLLHISWVIKGSVCFVLKFELPPFSPPFLPGVQISK